MALSQQETQLIIKLITEKIPSILAIYLFGSRAKSQALASSDIDIAVLLPFNYLLPEEERWNIAQIIAIKFDLEVDLIVLNTSSTVLQFQVIYEGQCLYKKDSKEVEKYNSLIFSLYVELLERRKDIIADIKKRGSIY